MLSSRSSWRVIKILFLCSLASCVGTEQDGSPKSESEEGRCAEVEEGSRRTLTCPSGMVIGSIDFASYGTPTGSCDGVFRLGSCHAASSVTVVEEACLDEQSCTVRAKNRFFGDPCVGTFKHLYVEYSCVGEGNSSGRCAEADEDSNATLTCPRGEVIESIDFASYGRPRGSCNTGFTRRSCHATSSMTVVEEACLDERSCTISANNDTFGDPCAGKRKHLYVDYTCSEGQTNGLVKVFVLAGQSNMEGHGHAMPETTRGTLAYMVENNPYNSLYSRLQHDNGEWVIRNDVWVEYNRESDPVSGYLTVGQGARPDPFVLIGPEYGFGFEVGEALQEDVVIIKTAWGGKSLAVDFRPPSSSGPTGYYYDQILNEVEDALDRLRASGRIVGNDYEIAGFGWHQGWNDGGEEAYIEEYQQNLSNLIRDLRQEWGTPDLPVVIGTSGQGGTHPPDSWFRAVSQRIRPAQMAVAEDPEFSSTVRAVDTISLWREPNESPSDQGHHWNRNGETYYLIGVRMGQAMVELLR